MKFKYILLIFLILFSINLYAEQHLPQSQTNKNITTSWVDLFPPPGTGGWYFYNDPIFHDPTPKACATGNRGDFVEVHFVGTGIDLITAVWAPTAPFTNFRVYIDETANAVSNGTATLYKQFDLTSGPDWLCFTNKNICSNLPFGYHTMTLEFAQVATYAGEELALDGFIIHNHYGIIKNLDKPSDNVYAGDTRTAMAFQCADAYDHKTTGFSVTNLGTLRNGLEISTLKLYYDENGNGSYDGSETWIADGVYSAGKWNFIGLSIKSGTNLVITMSINPTPATKNSGLTFQGAILSGHATCESNTSNINSMTNNGLYTLIIPIGEHVPQSQTNIKKTSYVEYFPPSGGGWSTYNDALFHPPTPWVHGTGNRGDFVEFHFVGTGVDLITAAWWPTDPFTNFKVYVDETPNAVSNGTATLYRKYDLLSAPDWAPYVVTLCSNLTFGYHTVIVEFASVSAPAGEELTLDGFIVYDHLGVIKNGDFGNTNIVIESDIPVLAFQCIDALDHDTVSISITNLGTMQSSDISSMKLYYDVNGNYDYDAGTDVYIATGIYAGGDWDFSLLSIASRTNLIVTIDIDTAAISGRTFQGAILSSKITCESNETGFNSITNNGLYTLVVSPPGVGSITPSPSTVSNNNNEKLSFTAIITDTGQGIGSVYMNLSLIGNSSSQTLTFISSNGSIATYKVSNLTIPGTVNPNTYTVWLYAYEQNNIIKSSNSTTIDVISFEPPIIGSIIISPPGTNNTGIVSNNNNQTISFTTFLTDKGGGIGGVVIDLSLLGNSAGFPMTNTAGNRYDSSPITVPSSVTLGLYPITVYASNNANSDYNWSTGIVEVIGNHKPIADAGTNQTATSGDKVTLDGTGSSDPDGNNLTFKWKQLSGPKVTIKPNNSTNASNPTFIAPDVEEKTTIKIRLIVQDDGDGNLESSADIVIITIEPPPAPETDYQSDLKNAHIYPNPVSECEPFTLSKLTEGKIIMEIYDILGHLVWENEFNAEQNLGWISYSDGLCNIGKELASGIYIVMISDESGNEKRIKLIYKK